MLNKSSTIKEDSVVPAIALLIHKIPAIIVEESL